MPRPLIFLRSVSLHHLTPAAWVGLSFGLAACSGEPVDSDWPSGSGGAANSSSGGIGNDGVGGALSGATGGSDATATGGEATTSVDEPGTATGGRATSGDGTGGESGDPTCSGKTGFSVNEGKIYDINCNEFIARGVNDPYAWYKSNSGEYPPFEQRVADIASVGANSIRVVLASGDHPEGWGRVSGGELTSIIDWCKENKLVAILEVHDSTGSGENQGVPGPQVAVDYWKSAEIKEAIVGQEAYIWINIANEAFGNSMSEATDASNWRTFYTGAVAELRAAGLKHTLVVDAPNWGQDYRWIMRDGTEPTDVFNADPEKNTVFSVHMYDVYGQASTITTYFDNFMQKGLPLIVGEFAADHGSGKDVDEATIMAQAEARGLGYLGWSWDGNSADLSSLDIVNNWDPASLSAWGAALVDDPNGIKNTSSPCTCFFPDPG